MPEIKLIKFGSQVPSNKVLKPSYTQFAEGALDGTPDGWVLTLSDMEAAAYALKYGGWALLSPNEWQGPWVPNQDGHQSAKDFLFKQISEVELKLRVVAPEYPQRAKAMREAKEAGVNLIVTDIPEIARPYFPELKYDPAEWEEYTKEVDRVENFGTADEKVAKVPVRRIRRKGQPPSVTGGADGKPLSPVAPEQEIDTTTGVEGLVAALSSPSLSLPGGKN